MPNGNFHHIRDTTRLSQDYDYVVALGLLSWISPKNRALLYAIATYVLKPGGAAAFGYNTLPGRGPEQLVQRLVLDHVRAHGGSQSAAIRDAFHHVKALTRAGAAGLLAPRLAGLLEDLDRQDPDFLPHEYLSEHWCPLHSADVIRDLDAHELCFAGSLTLAENRPDFVLRAALRDMVTEVTDPAARARLQDLATDQCFRRDLFVKRPAGPSETQTARDGAWLQATAPADHEDMTLTTAAGTLRFENKAARCLLEALQDGPLPLADAGRKVSRGDRLNTLDALAAAGLVVPVEPPADVQADPLNEWLAIRAARDVPTVLAQAGRYGATAVPRAQLQALGGKGRSDPAVLARLGL